MNRLVLIPAILMEIIFRTVRARTPSQWRTERTLSLDIECSNSAGVNMQQTEEHIAEGHEDAVNLKLMKMLVSMISNSL
jgi:hypothetical protein